MTIGEAGNLDPFAYMQKLRSEVASKFEIKEEKLELSMGMTADYDEAVTFICTFDEYLILN